METYVLDTLREQLSRRQSVDGGSRNLLRLMTATCGYSEVRTISAQRLEMWLQNPKVILEEGSEQICISKDMHVRTNPST